MFKKIIFFLLFLVLLITGFFFWHYKDDIEDVSDIVEIIDKQANNFHHLGFKGKVCIVKFGNFPESELAFVKRQIVGFYGFSIDSIIVADLPDSAFYTPRKRYKARKLLNFLNDIKPSNCDKIIGLTTQDISTPKGRIDDSGIMGLAYLGGESCVVSTFRISRGKPSKAKIRERLAKVSLHEIGHTLGIPHCNNSPICMLNDAKGTIKTIDREEIFLCPSCREKISYVKTLSK